MRTYFVVSSATACCLVAGLLLLEARGTQAQASMAAVPVMTEAAASIGSVPIAFVENVGQWPEGMHASARFGAVTAWLHPVGWTLAVCGQAPMPATRNAHASAQVGTSVAGVSVRMTVVGASGVAPVSLGRLQGHHNYMLGNDRERWRTHVPLHAGFEWPGIRPGIDLRCYAADGHFEYDLVLAPGVALADVEIQVDGATGIAVEADGSLRIDTVIGPVHQLPPRTFTIDEVGERREVQATCELRGIDRFGFAVPDWSGDTPLTIDPGIVYSTFLGAGSYTLCQAIDIDDDGVLTVAGSVASGLPTTPGAWDTSFGFGFYDAFVTRLDPSQPALQQLIYSTYVGGAGADYAYAMSVDDAGIVTIAGNTSSGDYPISAGAFDSSYNGGSDAFVSRLDPSQSAAQQLRYSTFFGGSSSDVALALAVRPSGAIAIGGWTGSLMFPTTAGCLQSVKQSASPDGFLAVFDPSLVGSQQLRYSTYLGGNLDDRVHGLAVSATGALHAAGFTSSTNFPTTAGAFAAGSSGDEDAFVVSIDPSQTGAAQLAYSTLFGGGDEDRANALALAPSGVITIVGTTRSLNLPTTAGARSTASAGLLDAFVARIDPSLPATGQLSYSTYVGGAADDLCVALDVDAAGVVTAAGYTGSANFPTTAGAYRTTYTGGYDTFVFRIDPQRPATGQLVYSTYVGGNSQDYATALAIDGTGAAAIAGFSESFNYPTTVGAWDRTYTGIQDAIITRLDMLPTGVSWIGASSPGCDGSLPAGVSSMPRVGNTAFSVTCSGAASNAIGLAGFTDQGLTTAAAVLGVEVWLDPTQLFVPATVFSNPAGAADLPLPIPANATLVGTQLFVQFVWLGPTTPPCPPQGFSASNALRLTIQP
jgi:hypothetical protein